MSKTNNINYSELKETLKKSKKSFIYVAIFSLFINLLMLVPPLYMLQLYDRVLQSRSEETLYMLTLVVVFLFITMALLEIVRSKMLVKIGTKLDVLLSSRIFDALFKFEVKNPGKGNSSGLSDLSQLRQFLTGNGMFAFFDAPWIFIYIGVLFVFHPYFGYFSILSVIILAILGIVNEKTTKDKLHKAHVLGNQSLFYVDTHLKNSEVVSAMGMKNDIEDNWKKKHYASIENQSSAANKAGVWSNISKSMRLLLQSLMLGLGGYLAIHDEVSSGMMIAGSIILGRALAPLDLITGSWKNFNGARTAYFKIEQLLKDHPKNEEFMPLPPPVGDVALESIVVVPPGASQPSVMGVSMLINKGEVIGLIGPSAAGKSSLVRAMLGVWPLAAGKVRIDNADIHQWNKIELGKFIGYLPQDIELFEGSISQNIARLSEVDSEKVVEAAQKANVHEMILRLPEGYDTKIGVGGVSLSGGQRQRIAFARAIYDNPVLVVLDEPNSNLDDQGERELVNAVRHLKEIGTTVVVISHRSSILDATDKLAIMKNGQLETYGPTQEIMEKMQEAINMRNQQMAENTANPMQVPPSQYPGKL